MSIGGNFKTIGKGPSVFRSGPFGGLSQYAIDWETWIIANGGNILPATLKIIDDNFFKPAAANGNILDQLDRLNIYAGLNGYEIAARTNMIKNAHFVTPVSSPVFDNNGYKSAGAGSYLDLNYTPSTEAVKLQRNSSIEGYVVKNPGFSGTKRAIGGATFTGFTSRFDHIRETGQLTVFQSDTTGSSNTNTVTSGNIFVAGRRTAASGANCKEAIIETNVQGFNVASAQLTDVSLYELTANYDGTDSSDVDTEYHLASFNGSSAFDYAVCRTLLLNTFTALGV
jgi:hypothetical protein